MLVSGYSGIGKSSVVNELQKVLVLPRGLFASGKFDQYKRDIPYATLAQAFQGLIRPLLSKSDAELQQLARRPSGGVRSERTAHGGPGSRIDAHHRRAASSPRTSATGRTTPLPASVPALHRRIRKAEHPLALFLDDLQWLDAATLDLIEDLLIQPDVQHLLLIGAYRDNEVDATHPLLRKLEAIRGAGALVQKITLAPLAKRRSGKD